MEVKVLERCRVSPPPNSVDPTSTPLSFFDIPWLLCRPMQRIFLYEVEFSNEQFSNEVVPQLKHSLSLALQLFYPFSGNLVCPPPPGKPRIVYNDGDSVALVVAESDGDFRDLVRDGLRNVKEIHPLVPPMLPSRVLDDTSQLISLLAAQVTLFPNYGICIGIQFNHVVADGMGFHYFLKAWASILKVDNFSSFCTAPPYHDRKMINDSEGIQDTFLNQWRAWGSPIWKEDIAAAFMEDKARATFILTRDNIERLKRWIAGKFVDRLESRPLHISSFVVTCAFTWVCLIKSQDEVASNAFGDEELCHFCFVADCRNRYDSSVPLTYSGNSLVICFVSIRRGELRGEDSIVTAAEAIGRRVQDLENGFLTGADKWLLQWQKVSKCGDLFTVAGSPRLAVYDTDFGWGRPIKVELVQIDASGAMSLAEARNEIGGVEIGLVRSRRQMEAFTSIFQQFNCQLS